MEANFVASGISYRAKTEKTPETYNHLRWVKVWAFETMQHPMDATGNWNIGSHLWLKYYIMLRWIDRKLPRGKMQMGPYMLVFLVSAVWHGFFFGYYAFFSGLGLMDFTWKAVEKTQLVSGLVNSKFGTYVGRPLNWLCCQIVISYFGMPYVLRTVEPCIAMWSAFGYAGHWGCILVIILASLLPQADKKKVQDSSKSTSSASTT